MKRPRLADDEWMLVEMNLMLCHGWPGIASLTSQRFIWQYVRASGFGRNPPFARAIPARIDIDRDEVVRLIRGGGPLSLRTYWFELVMSDGDAFEFTPPWPPSGKKWQKRIDKWIEDGE